MKSIPVEVGNGVRPKSIYPFLVVLYQQNSKFHGKHINFEWVSPTGVEREIGMNATIDLLIYITNPLSFDTVSVPDAHIWINLSKGSD